MPSCKKGLEDAKFIHNYGEEVSGIFLVNLTKILRGSLRHYYLPEPQFKQMDQFISGVRSLDVKPASLFARGDGDFELVLEDGARIIFNSKQEYSPLLENLETVLEGAGL